MNLFRVRRSTRIRVSTCKVLHADLERDGKKGHTGLEGVSLSHCQVPALSELGTASLASVLRSVNRTPRAIPTFRAQDSF